MLAQTPLLREETLLISISTAMEPTFAIPEIADQVCWRLPKLVVMYLSIQIATFPPTTISVED